MNDETEERTAIDILLDTIQEEYTLYGEKPEEIKVTPKLFNDLIISSSTSIKLLPGERINQVIFHGIKITAVTSLKPVAYDVTLRKGGDRMALEVLAEDGSIGVQYFEHGLEFTTKYLINYDYLHSNYIVPPEVDDKLKRMFK